MSTPEELESYLRKQSQNDSTPMVRTLLSTLGDAIIMNESNVETNRKLWDIYATNWSQNNPMIQSMAHHSRTMFNQSMTKDKTQTKTNNEKKNKQQEQLTCLGDEWSRDEDVKQVINDYILPYFDLKHKSFHVMEIGSGGGRISSKICDYCKYLYCLDISKEMLTICQKYLNSLNKKNVSFHLLKCDKNIAQKPPKFPNIKLIDNNDNNNNKHNENKFDFIFAFDAFVHMDIHTQFSYFKQIFDCLKNNSYAFIHTSNIETEYGFKRFNKQTHATVAGFYFVNPSMIDLLLHKSGFTIVKRSNINGDNKKDNIYYQRDYLVIVQKIVDKKDKSNIAQVMYNNSSTNQETNTSPTKNASNFDQVNTF